MNEEAAASLAEAINSNDQLENLVLKCKFENRAAFQLVFDAIVENQTLKKVIITHFGDDELTTLPKPPGGRW